MRAAVTHGPHDVRVEDVAEPVAGPGRAVVQVSAVGLCGTDLHMYAGERHDTGFPLRQGHEIGGHVAELPTGYDGPLSLGDVVAVDPSMPCGSCRACARGRWPSCSRFSAVGVALPGGLAERVAVPLAQLHHAADLTGEDAALAEPLSIATMALHQSALTGGERLLVTGAGPIGLALVLCAGLRGIPVMVTDPVPTRLALAAELGADEVVDATSGRLSEAVAEWTDGDGVDVALEASGSRTALTDCLAALGRGGRLVVVGVAAHDLVVPLPRVLFEGVSVSGARAGLFPGALAVLAARPALVRRLVSHRFGLDEVSDAFAFTSGHPHEAVKVLVTCNP